MNVSNYDLLFFIFNSACAVANAYHSPISFGLSFLATVPIGVVVSIKNQVNLIYVDYCEISKNKLTASTRPFYTYLQQQAEKTTAVLLEKYSIYIPQSISRTTQKVLPYVKPFFRFGLTISGYGKIFTTVQNMTMNYDQQRNQINKKISIIPSKKQTILSVAALAANLGYLTIPILSSVRLFAGIPSGYACGIWIGNKSCKWLRAQTPI